MHGMHSLSLKGIQQGEVDQITGMDDDIAVGKTMLNALKELFIDRGEMVSESMPALIMRGVLSCFRALAQPGTRPGHWVYLPQEVIRSL
ncbi:MAG: hypothetical protein Q3M24_10915 [Candidatus Electrothrix aestuarii]|uniref:Substrate-binding protein-like domain-containing protein n=1 Tax=Candidatus Electrothrix aestuarii TaxID=3062594 RepID=A0AAU8M111_9BACT|nr:hypothetical protein [Candidatus Electrothrix aestuarii]